MGTSEQQDIFERHKARIDFYRFLASIFKLELTADQIEVFAQTKLPCDETDMGKGYSLIAHYLNRRDTGTRQELAVDYAHTFLGAGEYDTLTAPPYESVYTSDERILMQDARDDVLRCYRSEGLDLSACNTTPEDHISFELQFMALLIEQAMKAVEDGDGERIHHALAVQRSFFTEHLANWVPLFAADILAHAKTDFYRGVAYLIRGFLEEEKAFLEYLMQRIEIEAA